MPFAVLVEHGRHRLDRLRAFEHGRKLYHPIVALGGAGQLMHQARLLELALCDRTEGLASLVHGVHPFFFAHHRLEVRCCLLPAVRIFFIVKQAEPGQGGRHGLLGTWHWLLGGNGRPAGKQAASDRKVSQENSHPGVCAGSLCCYLSSGQAATGGLHYHREGENRSPSNARGLRLLAGCKFHPAPGRVLATGCASAPPPCVSAGGRPARRCVRRSRDYPSGPR